MLFNNPISSEKANRIIQLLDVFADSNVLDVGCGHGEFLIRVIKASDARGLGIDVDEEAVAAAQEKAASRIPDAVCEFRTADIREVPLLVFICLRNRLVPRNK